MTNNCTPRKLRLRRIRHLLADACTALEHATTFIDSEYGDDIPPYVDAALTGAEHDLDALYRWCENELNR